MNIQVSIAEDITVVSAVINDKNSLEIVFKQGQTLDLFEAMNNGGSLEETSSKYLEYPVNNKWYGAEATPLQMVNKLRQLNAKYQHLLSVDVAEKDYAFNMFEGTPIKTSGDIDTYILQEEVYTKIGTNIFKNFIKNLEKAKSPIRIKFVRQSQAKHFISLPDYLGFKKDGGEFKVPFVESMLIPKEQSKLTYTKYELDKGLDNPNPVVADTQPSGDSDLPFILN